jgi:hypothetical protein
LPFETTRWSLVLAAAGNDSQAREALSSLCQTYWYPLYAYLRRRGLDPEDARDLTQGFLTSLIERQDFDGLRQDQWTAQGRASEFDELKACLLGQAPVGGYAAVAARLGTSEGAVKAAVHRLRRRFQSLLRQRVAETVADGRDVDDEIRHLIQALSA